MVSLHYTLTLVGHRNQNQLTKHLLHQFGIKKTNLRKFWSGCGFYSLFSSSLVVPLVDNLPLPTSKESKKMQVVVTATLYHSKQVLSEKQQTGPRPLNNEGKLDVNETFMFGVVTRDLPKVSGYSWSL